MFQLGSKLNRHVVTLTDMYSSLSVTDQAFANTITNATTIRAIQLINIGELLSIAERMVDKSDWAVVHKSITNYKNLFDSSCIANVQLINKSLGLARSTAVVSEAEHLRDDLAAVCDRVKSMR